MDLKSFEMQVEAVVFRCFRLGFFCVAWVSSSRFPAPMGFPFELSCMGCWLGLCTRWVKVDTRFEASRVYWFTIQIHWGPECIFCIDTPGDKLCFS